MPCALAWAFFIFARWSGIVERVKKKPSHSMAFIPRH